ncbi:MAG TPA: hypothetical protein VMM18_08730 [Gemmatimonadaceae bacterium]|nr:hypothetical protein [Gemmatimonadaceae bacterium]
MAFLLGILAGVHTSSWGMYKDAPHEGFTVPKYLRSVIVAAILAIVLQRLLDFQLATWADAAVFFGVVYAAERLTLELWKSFIREEDQSKYFIPMQFGVLGKPIRSRAVRWSILGAIVVVLIASVWFVVWLQRTYPDLPPWLVILTIGSLGGWYSAFGGAWKDAPVEGFETFKFFRSPGIAIFWSAVMAFLTTNWIYLALAGIGYTVATIETYKTFFFPNKPRGKFAGKPVRYPGILEQRKYVAVLYAGIWTIMIAMLLLAFLGQRQGMLP